MSIHFTLYKYTLYKFISVSLVFVLKQIFKKKSRPRHVLIKRKRKGIFIELLYNSLKQTNIRKYELLNSIQY